VAVVTVVTAVEAAAAVVIAGAAAAVAIADKTVNVSRQLSKAGVKRLPPSFF